MAGYVYRRWEPGPRLPVAPYVMREDRAFGWHWTDEQRQAVTAPFDPNLCGTPRGYRQHRRRGQAACQPCKDVMAKLSLEQRQKDKRSREETQ